MRVFFLFLTLNLLACSADLGSEGVIEVSVDATNPTWAGGIQELVERKCSSCHRPDKNQFVPADTPDTFDFINDESFFTTNRITIQTRLNDTADPMPPEFATPLTSNEALALENYINSL